jgi:hypothetical protein
LPDQNGVSCCWVHAATQAWQPRHVFAFKTIP